MELPQIQIDSWGLRGSEIIHGLTFGDESMLTADFEWFADLQIKTSAVFGVEWHLFQMSSWLSKKRIIIAPLQKRAPQGWRIVLRCRQTPVVACLPAVLGCHSQDVIAFFAKNGSNSSLLGWDQGNRAPSPVAAPRWITAACGKGSHHALYQSQQQVNCPSVPDFFFLSLTMSKAGFLVFAVHSEHLYPLYLWECWNPPWWTVLSRPSETPRVKFVYCKRKENVGRPVRNSCRDGVNRPPRNRPRLRSIGRVFSMR